MSWKIGKIACLFFLSCICTTFIKAQDSGFVIATPDLTAFAEVPVEPDDPGYSEMNFSDSNSVFDPNLWKITFPLENPQTGNALEVLNPEFSSYVLGIEAWPEELAKYFYTTDEGQAFYCEYTSVTTPNSNYARTELREMVGADQHNWTLQTGGHLYGRLKVTDFKEGANKLFFMQIHGKAPTDKPLLKCIWEKGRIRLITKSGEGLTDYKKGDNGKYTEVGEDWFTCTIDVDTAALSIKINGETIETFDYEEVLQYWPGDNTYYFKAGNYLQHDREGAAATVTYSELEVSHDTNPPDPTGLGHIINVLNNNNLLIETYPNPFSNETTIRFNTKTVSRGSLSIFNMNGIRIKSFYVNKMLHSGSHSIVWDGKNNAGNTVASGTYFYIFNGVSGTEVFNYCDKIVFTQ
jgi:hypothetical protein